MKYINFYESKIERTFIQKLNINGLILEFPLYLVFIRKDYYGQEKIHSLTIDSFNRSENYIWGDSRIEFVSKVTTPHYDHVTESIDSYTISELMSMIERHNEYVNSDSYGNDGYCYNLKEIK